MKKSRISRTLIISIFFALFSFFPILQLIFVTYDGGILYLIEKYILKSESKLDIANWILNCSLSILFLILYYRSRKKITEIIYSIFFLIFSFCFIYFQVYEFQKQEIKPYFLLFLIECIISGIILNIVSNYKTKREKASS